MESLNVLVVIIERDREKEEDVEMVVVDRPKSATFVFRISSMKLTVKHKLLRSIG